MQYRKGPDGEMLSALGFGCMRLPTKNGRIDETRAKELILTAIENGVNYFDTAVPYHLGASEPFLGRALTGVRNKVNIATKLPHWSVKSRSDMENILKSQLENLKTDRIDYYLVHSLAADSWEKMKELGVREFLTDMKKSGKIRFAGFSFHGDKAAFPKILDEYDWDFCQIQFNYLDKNSQAGEEGLKYAGKKGIPVMIMEPLRGGTLAGGLPDEIKAVFREADPSRTPAEWSLRWIYSRPEVAVVLSGMNTQEQLMENIKTAENAFAGPLCESEEDAVNKASQIFRERSKVPCTGCRYCMPCPFKVNIPECFAMYNEYFMFNRNKKLKFQYLGRMGGLLSNKSYAGLCRKCGKCRKACPQSIDIPNELKSVSKTMEGPLFRILMPLMKPVMAVQSKISVMRSKIRKN